MAVLAAAVPVLAARVSAQTLLDYNKTTFLNGFASSTGIWQRYWQDLGPQPEYPNTTTPMYLAKRVKLRTVVLHNVDASQTWSQQVAKAGQLAWGPQVLNRQVIVAHSLGGLVARGLYVDNPVAPPYIAGIITLATPHQGTQLADSIYNARNFLLDVQRRVNDGITTLRIVAPLVELFGAKVLLSKGVYVSGPTFLAVATSTQSKLADQEIDLNDITQLPQVPAIADLKTTSYAVTHLNATTTDAGIQRATIMGTTPHRNAVFALRQSLMNDDIHLSDAIHNRNLAVSAFDVCKVVGYGVLFGARQGRICARASTALGRVDDRWTGFVNGRALQTVYLLGKPFTLVLPRMVPFDGVVSNERSNYPGLADPLRRIIVPGTNHQNIYATKAALNRVGDVMLAFGMEAVSNAPGSQLAATISGPSSLATGSDGTWTATASGGSPEYKYSWSGFLAGSGSSISGSGSGTLTLTVTDVAGATVTVSKFVTVGRSTDCGRQLIC